MEKENIIKIAETQIKVVGERAKFILKDEEGKEYTLLYEGGMGQLFHLTIQEED